MICGMVKVKAERPPFWTGRRSEKVLYGGKSMESYLNLQLFDGGAAAAAGDGTGSALPDAGDAGRGTKRAETPKVVYGRQPEPEAAPDAGEQAGGAEKPWTKTTSDALDAKKAAFDELIRGEYKDLFGERVQAIIDKRFKETKALEAQSQKLQPLLDILGQKYGVSGGDPEALAQAIEEDNSFFEEAALKQGLSVEQFKQMQKLQRENEGFRRAQQEAERRAQNEQTVQRWMQEERQVKQLYPDFSLQAEFANPEFAKLLKSGVSVQAAYQAVHMDELMTGAMQATAAAVSRQVADNIRSRAERPMENGMSSQSGVVVKNDVSKLTAKDRREIARRAARGEEIRF